MARKFEWRDCKAFQPRYIPGIEIREVEKGNIIAFGLNYNLPDEGPYLKINESMELLKKLKKSGYDYYRLERVPKPDDRGYTIAFIGKGDNPHDKGSAAGVIAPLLTIERDGWYWEPTSFATKESGK